MAGAACALHDLHDYVHAVAVEELMWGLPLGDFPRIFSSTSSAAARARGAADSDEADADAADITAVSAASRRHARPYDTILGADLLYNPALYPYPPADPDKTINSADRSPIKLSTQVRTSYTTQHSTRSCCRPCCGYSRLYRLRRRRVGRRKRRRRRRRRRRCRRWNSRSLARRAQWCTCATWSVAGRRPSLPRHRREVCSATGRSSRHR